MRKADLIANVADNLQMTKKDTARVVNEVFDEIARTMQSGESVSIVGFGTFSVRTRAEQRGVSLTGKGEQIIPETRVPSFRAGKALKDSVRKRG